MVLWQMSTHKVDDKPFLQTYLGTDALTKDRAEVQLAPRLAWPFFFKAHRMYLSVVAAAMGSKPFELAGCAYISTDSIIS